MSQFRRYTAAPKRGPFIAVAVTAAVAIALMVPQNAFAATASPAAASSASSASAASLTVAQMTQVVWQDVDAVRAKAGKPVLVRNTALDKVAADWAKQQYLNGAMSHNPNYSKQIPAGWQRAGENVAKGYYYNEVVDAWVASSSHYANLIGDYTDIGIGYYEADGKRYWSQVFGKYPSTKVPARSSGTSTSAPAAPTSAAPEPAAPAGAVITLSSPSFEGSLSGWNAPGATLIGPNSEAKGGRYALGVSGNRTITQSVTVSARAGETYTATIWVRPATAAAVSGSLKLATVGGTTEAATMSFKASSGWMKVSVPLKITKTGHTGLTFSVVLPSGSSRIDSASLVRTTTPTTATSPTKASAASPDKTAVLYAGSF